jgi:chromosomal replication initiator protein
MRKNSPMEDLLKKIKIKKENVNEEPVAINQFGLNSKYIFENFIVGKGNELAHAASQAVAANPGNAYNPMFIYGGVGLGKTHLVQAIGNHVFQKNPKARIRYIHAERYVADIMRAYQHKAFDEFKRYYHSLDLLLIDDIQFMAGKDGTQEEFFHTFNELHQTNKQIVLTSDRQPQAIPALEKRLLSRFQWGMIADIGQPDIETRVAILEAKCKEKNYALEPEILVFIANNIQSNIRELEGALNRLIVFHEFNNTKPTTESTKSILSSILSTLKTKSITTKDIIEAVSRFFEVDVKEIMGKSRKKELVYPRQITMYLMRKEANISYPTIGNELGGRDHTTAMHACNKMMKEVEESEKIKQDIDSIKQLVYSS